MSSMQLKIEASVVRMSKVSVGFAVGRGLSDDDLRAAEPPGDVVKQASRDQSASFGEWWMAGVVHLLKRLVAAQHVCAPDPEGRDWVIISNRQATRSPCCYKCDECKQWWSFQPASGQPAAGGIEPTLG
jgi:hypothetical protein